ncbi:FAD-dependent oxidoreductase [Haloferula sp. BvORR071]|uniref:FAD-dependent oxidoreductase n=1 Tax=Haloferula sp. BvORR071 TaxID=1396141 RepID=UPI000559003A|nr:FAD-dependent oxidoreductase [Haloferula sp. BvORR071]
MHDRNTIRDTTPYWEEGRKPAYFHPLDQDLSTQVLVIGSGITGLTTAWLLAREGQQVVLVERDGVAKRDTAHTTAHLTYMTDTRLSDLVATFSRREAIQAWQAGQAAMTFIADTVAELRIDCGLRTVPGYLIAAENCDAAEEETHLQEEAEMARQFGFDVMVIDQGPVTKRPAIRFANQMEFHSLSYLDALAQAARDTGVKMYTEAEVTAFEDEPRRVKANGHWIEYDKVIIATHVPLQGEAGTLGATLFQSKLIPCSTYAVAAIIPGTAPEPMIWSDTAEPFLYLRISPENASHLAILGGKDHKTGQAVNTPKLYTELERKLAEMLPAAQVTHHWSGQVIETVDGLPYIGATSDHQFIATGFSGNGMTFGTVSAMMARDWLLGRRTPWTQLFDPGRKSGAALKEYLKQNTDSAVRLIKDRLKVKEGNPEDIAPGEGKVIEQECKRLAVSRDADGTLHRLNAVCPPPRLHRGMEPSGRNLGLPLPRLALCRGWHRACRPRRIRSRNRLKPGPCDQRKPAGLEGSRFHPFTISPPFGCSTWPVM